MPELRHGGWSQMLDQRPQPPTLAEPHQYPSSMVRPPPRPSTATESAFSSTQARRSPPLHPARCAHGHCMHQMACSRNARDASGEDWSDKCENSADPAILRRFRTAQQPRNSHSVDPHPPSLRREIDHATHAYSTNVPPLPHGSKTMNRRAYREKMALGHHPPQKRPGIDVDPLTESWQYQTTNRPAPPDGLPWQSNAAHPRRGPMTTALPVQEE